MSKSQYTHLLGSQANRGGGHFQSRLSADQLEELDGFEEAMKSYRTKSGSLMSEGSRRSYRTYMAEVMVITTEGGDLENHKNRSSLRSAIRLFESLMSE